MNGSANGDLRGRDEYKTKDLMMPMQFPYGDKVVARYHFHI